MMGKVLAAAIFPMLLCAAVVRAPAQPDRTVANFLLDCFKKHDAWSECSFAVTTMGAYDEYNELGTHSTCPPRSKSDAEIELEVTSVVNWLSTHPRTQSMAEPEGIVAALSALYPCARESGKKSDD
jgi:hypothetical protein